MHRQVFIQFRMEGGSQLIPISDCHNIVIDGSQHFRAMCLFHIRCTDKSHGNLTDPAHLLPCMKAAQLAAIGVSSDSHRKGSEITALVIGKAICQKDLKM